MANDISKLSDEELLAAITAKLKQGENTTPQAPEPSAIGATWEGVKSGFKRALQGIHQMGVHSAGVVGAEDFNPAPPLSPAEVKAYDDRLRADTAQEDKALSPARQAHPWLFGGGNIVGGIAATAPLALMVPGGSTLAGLAAQGAIMGAAQPVTEGDYGSQKLSQALTGAGYGLVGGAVAKNLLPGLAQAWNFPKQTLNYTQRSEMATPYAQRGLEVANETGIDLTPAMVSGSRIAKQAENVANRSMWSADTALQAHQKLTGQALQHADDLVNQWTGGRGGTDPITLGRQLQSTTRNAVDDIHNAAMQRYQQDIAPIASASIPGFNFANTKSVLQQVIKENENNLTDTGIKLAEQAKVLLGRIDAVESTNLKRLQPDVLMELADNAYQRAATRYPDNAEKIISSNGGFSAIAKNPETLALVYRQLEGLARSSPVKVFGPRPSEPVSLTRRIVQLGGLNSSEMADVIGESKLSATVRKGMPAGLFRVNAGRSSDDMARVLVDEGYLQPGEVMGDDGVRALFRKIKNELDGNQRYYRPEDMGNAQARQQWDDAASRATAPIPDAMPIPGGQVPIRSAIALRRQFGKAAKGSGNVFEDIHPSEERRLAGRLFGAINEDFDSAANNTGGQIGKAFQQANERYKMAMDSIDYIEQSALGKALGKDITDALYSGAVSNTGTAPDKFVQQITKLPPSSLMQARTILEQHNPQLLQDLKAYTLQQAIERGQTLAPSMGTKVTFDPAKAATGLLTPKQRAALYTPDEARAVDMLDEALRRWADTHGMNFSNTATTGEFLKWFNRIGMGALGAGSAIGSAVMGGPLGMLGAAAAAKGSVGYYFGTRQIAEAMLNPGDRMQLLRVINAPITDPRIVQAVGALMAKYGSQQSITGGERGGNDRNR